MRARVVLALAVTLWAPPLCASASAQAASSRAVLTIHLGPETFPTNPVLDAGIREALASHPDVKIEYFAEYLESDLFPGRQATQAFADYIRRKYQGRRVDLVVAYTDEALRFVLDHRRGLFPGAPVVFSGLTVPDEVTRSADGGLTGIRIGTAYAETLRLALELHPSTRRVFVVARGADERTIESVRAALSALSDRVSIVYLNEQTVSHLLSAVKAIPAGSVILYIWHHPQNELGNLLYADDVARLVAQAATVPVYGTSDFYIGSGIVGGVMRGTRETGTRLGEIALRILTGTRPLDIPIEEAPLVPVIDWRQVERWGIDYAGIPAQSRVLFREPSAWERYRLYVLGAVTALLAQTALIAVLLVQRAKRREAEQQVRRSQAALSTSHERVRDLGSRLLHAQEGERSRIAGELHDDISQQLAALKFRLGRLSRTVQGDAEAVVAETVKRVDAIVTSVRSLSHRIHPARLRFMGLVGGLEELQRELSRPDVAITFRHQNVPPDLKPDLALCLFRIAQEALQNALKHGRAHNVLVNLRGVSEGIALTIGDDGVGFDVGAVWGTGLGLVSMHERVEAIGGTFEICSAPDDGTWVEVRVPDSRLRDTEAVAV